MEDTALIDKMPVVNKTATPRGRLISLFPPILQQFFNLLWDDNDKFS